MKIDKNKPLPDHTKLDYDECCAKLILEEIFPEKYKNIIISDKPDLQCKNIGIEVTIANEQYIEEARNNWVKACSTDNIDKKQKYIERMKQLGIEYTGCIQFWPTFEPSLELTKQAVDKKIERLKKGNYKKYSKYELFIFTDTWFYDDLVEKAKSYFYEENVRKYYSIIYVLSEGLYLHKFDNCRGLYKLIKLDGSEQSNRNRRARKMVEDAEEEI